MHLNIINFVLMCSFDWKANRKLKDESNSLSVHLSVSLSDLNYLEYLKIVKPASGREMVRCEKNFPHISTHTTPTPPHTNTHTLRKTFLIYKYTDVQNSYLKHILQTYFFISLVNILVFQCFGDARWGGGVWVKMIDWRWRRDNAVLEKIRDGWRRQTPHGSFWKFCRGGMTANHWETLLYSQSAH